MFLVFDTKNMIRLSVLSLLCTTITWSGLQQSSLAQTIQGVGTTNGPSTATYGNSQVQNAGQGGTPATIRLGTHSGTNGAPGYMDRYPFALDSYNQDTLQQVSAGNNLRQSAPGTVHPILAYTPIIKFCNDNPMQGICYIQPPGLIAMDTPASARDGAVFNKLMATTGLPLTDTQFQVIDRENKQRFLELLFDPERWMWTTQNSTSSMFGSASNSLASSAQTNFQSAYNNIAGAQDSSISALFGTNSTGGMINVANEQSGFPVGDFSNKQLSQVIWMIQQMYRNVYMQMAILFLLVGATLTQAVGMVKRGFLNWGAQDVTGPFDGMLRSVIAIFLIPATQLFLSYAIDVGNTMANSVYPWINLPAIVAWAQEQTYNPPNTNVNNAILPPGSGINVGNQLASFTQAGATTPGALGGTGGIGGVGGTGTSGLSVSLNGASFGASVIGSSFINNIVGSLFGGGLSGLSTPGAGGQGKADQIPETQTIQEEQLWLSTTMQFAFNLVQWLFTWIVARMTEFQVVLMSYLFLLGPLCACFFAFPAITQTTFRGIFANWLNTVISVSLWRFQWCVILAIMSLHAETCTAVNSQFEMMIAVCFLGLMMVVPFNPFTFQPGETATMALMRGSALAEKGMKAAGMSDQQIQQTLGPIKQVSQGMWNGQMSTMGYSSPGMASMYQNQQSGTGQGGQGAAANNDVAAMASMYQNQQSGAGQGGGAMMPPMTGGGYSPSSTTNSMFAPPPSSAASPPSYHTGQQSSLSGEGNIQPLAGVPMVPLSASSGGSSPQFLVQTASASAATAGVTNLQQFMSNNPTLANTTNVTPPPITTGQAPPPPMNLAGDTPPPSNTEDDDNA
jgi:hypothetical protein